MKTTSYQTYVTSETWRRRAARHRRARPWCVAHGRPCRARDVHHASYWGWRHLGVELPWEKVGLCRDVHERIGRWHRGRRTSNAFIFAATWATIAWVRLTERHGR